mgnify:CR=1 FL=1
MRYYLSMLVLCLVTFACQSQHTDHPKTSKKYAHTNRLINESSPYLLQHAHNPVDWYPWSQEALEKAKKEKKMINLLWIVYYTTITINTTTTNITATTSIYYNYYMLHVKGQETPLLVERIFRVVALQF